MSKMFLPYILINELDKHFQSASQKAFDDEEFYDLVDTLQATGAPKNQKRAVALFKTLSRDEVLRRAKIVVRLDKLLMTIQSNSRNDISSSPTT